MPSFKIESLGYVTVTTDKGETIQLDCESICFMADEIRRKVAPPKSYGLELLSEMRPKEPDTDG